MTSEPPTPLTALLLVILGPRRRLSSRAATKPGAGLLVMKHNQVALGDAVGAVGAVGAVILRDEAAAGPAPAGLAFN
jgi:hypothetical protein